MIMSIEEEFDMEIDDEAVEGMKTVGDIVAFIENNNSKNDRHGFVSALFVLKRLYFEINFSY